MPLLTLPRLARTLFTAGGRSRARACTTRPSARRAALSAALGLAAVLAACGGSTSQFEAFVPLRVFALGDETSVVTAQGRNYPVNGLNADNTTVDCTLRPVWSQQVAGAYGFVFAECNPTNIEVKAFQRAAAGAKVGDLNAQIDAVLAGGGFRDKDLVTMLAGANDIIELYQQYPAVGEGALVAAAGERGRVFARAVNRAVSLNAKVVVSTLPDLALSPYALAQRAANSDIDRAALIGRLVQAFNEQLGVTVLLDGRFVGLVQMDLTVQAMIRSPASFGLVDVTTAICTVPLPDCTTATLVANVDASSSLWADGYRLATGGQSQLASLAVARAQRNPF